MKMLPTTGTMISATAAPMWTACDSKTDLSGCRHPLV